MDSRKVLNRKIQYLESMLEDVLGDAECQVMHQTAYLMNQLDYLKSKLLAFEVEEVFAEEEDNDE
jgi:hypothetical protein